MEEREEEGQSCEIVPGRERKRKTGRKEGRKKEKSMM